MKQWYTRAHMSTIFSKIISGEIPSYKIYEDEYVCAFLDINPMQRGHTLVIPKVEVGYIFDLEDDIYVKVMSKAKDIAKILKGKLNCTRVCILVEGYDVPHTHVKLIPTSSPRDFDSANIYQATKEELEEVQKLLLS